MLKTTGETGTTCHGQHSQFETRLSATAIHKYWSRLLWPCACTRWKEGYGGLFTCFTTCAVHLENAHSLDTNSCPMAIRRMMARRQQPANIWSDNVARFVGTKKELWEAVRRLDGKGIGDQLSANGMQWHLNPPSSPHFGDVWECLVQSAKRVLKGVAGKQCVNDETLLTLMAEVEL